MKLQIKFNVKTKCVYLRTSDYTTDRNAVQKCIEFLKAFFLGFNINDAIALLRLDDLYLDTFMIKDGKIFPVFLCEINLKLNRR
jgi:RNA-binding protein PNO1